MEPNNVHFYSLGEESCGGNRGEEKRFGQFVLRFSGESQVDSAKRRNSERTSYHRVDCIGEVGDLGVGEAGHGDATVREQVDVEILDEALNMLG